MPVFIKNNKKVLFIHIPKTGGTSVEKFFEKNGWKTDFLDRGGVDSINPLMKCSPQHLHSEPLANLFWMGNFDVIFAITRKPKSRIISEYKWKVKNAKIEESLDDFIANTFSAYSKNKYILDNHIRPQNEFICANTTIFHFEDGLESIIKWLENELSITFEFPTMPNTQTSITNKSKIDVNVSIETDEKIKRFYKEDYLICSP